MAGDDDLSVETLFHDELVVICSKRSKWARRRTFLWQNSSANRGYFRLQPASSPASCAAIRSARPGVSPCDRYDVCTYSLSVLVGNGNFLGIHPRTMLTSPMNIRN